MQIKQILSYSLLAGALALGACSKPDSAAPAVAAKQAVSYEAVASQAKGFTVGAMMSSNVVYVFFDTQCSHCGRLWEASTALQKKIKFVWIPVRMGSPISVAQGAALMTAADPAALMREHEASLLAGKGGISASSSIAPEIEKSIAANTQLLNSFGAQGVPFVVAKNLKTGLTVSNEGAMETPALAQFLGLDQP